MMQWKQLHDEIEATQQPAIPMLSTLPDDVVHLIVQRLSPAGVASLSCTCKNLYRVCAVDVLLPQNGQAPPQNGASRVQPTMTCSPSLWGSFCARAGLPQVPTSAHTQPRDSYFEFQTRAWRWRTGQLQHEQHLQGHTQVINSLALQPQSHTLPRTQKNMSTRAHGVSTGAICVQDEQWNKVFVRSSGGHVLASGGSDKAIRLWDISRGICVSTINAQAPVFCVKFGPLPDHLLWAGSDGNIKEYSVAEDCLLKTLSGHAGPVYDIDVGTINSPTMVTASEDSFVGIWGVGASGNHLVNSSWFQPHAEAVHCVRAAWQQGFAVAGTAANNLVMFDLNTLQSMHTIELRALSLERAQFPCCPNTLHLDGNSLMVGCDDGSVRAWDLRSGRAIHTFIAHSAGVLSLQFDNTKAITGAQDGIRVWDMRRWLSTTSPDVNDACCGMYSLSGTHVVRSLCFHDLCLFASVHSDVMLFDYREDAKSHASLSFRHQKSQHQQHTSPPAQQKPKRLSGDSKKARRSQFRATWR